MLKFLGFLVVVGALALTAATLGGYTTTPQVQLQTTTKGQVMLGEVKQSLSSTLHQAAEGISK